MNKRRFIKAVTVFVFCLMVLIGFTVATNQVLANTTPYYTYTTDNEQGWIRTSDAYTPSGQILDADGVRFRIPQYVYIDHEDYIYVTDAGYSKVFIFDKDYNFVDEIAYVATDDEGKDVGFFAVNSIFVTEDKIYVPDSFRKSIFIFDREETLNRQEAYNLWLEDVDASDTLTSGDLFYLSDEDTNQPIGDAVYEVNITGQNANGNDIISFLDVDSSEELFTKVDKEEMLGKLFDWTTAEYQGKTLLQHTIYQQKNIPIQIITTPDHPVFTGDPEDPFDGYTFTPRKVAVDTRGNMYIVGAQSDAGLIMLDSDGDYITFFGGNPIRLPLIDQIRSTLLTDEQKEKLREQSNIYIDYISSVAIDEKGFIYTVTSTLEDDVIKKFNVSGKNYFNTDARGWPGAVDLWVGQYGNVVIVEELGWINEYNADGELVFSFSIRDTGADREGLLSLPQSIAIDSNDQLYVVDQGNKIVQMYEPTAFTNAIHTAFQAYQDGDEILAQENWEFSLEYATVFDIAHEGLGNAFVRQDNYERALYHYQLASYNDGISDTFWQIRQTWMEQNLEIVILGLLILFVLRGIFKFFNKRYHFTKGLEKSWQKLVRQNQVLRELLYIKYYIMHPLDAYYEIKRKNAVSVKTAVVIYFLLAVLYIFYQTATNVIFLADPNPNIIYELIILISILSLWVIANYFVCLVRDGEGSFKNVFVATAMTLTPLLIVVPMVTILSNVLTYQEAVFYNGPLVITYIWVAIYFFFMIKEIHNYEVGETFGIIGISVFTMLIMGIFIFVIYSIDTQIFNVTEQIARELMER
jgi:hypothetical protein